MTDTTRPVAPVGDSVLSLTGVDKRFGAVQALTDVSLDVRAGEVVALVGDNGAGKSTLVKIIAGRLPARRGRDRLRRPHGRGHRPRRGPGRSASRRSSRTSRCATTSTSSPTSSSARSARRSAVLDEVTMEKEAWRLLRTLSAKIPSVRIPIASLSGGQRQTVAIARSLVGEPKVVMLDEPTAALGVAQTAEVLNLVERLRETGLGVILISHNMADVQAVADRIVVLRLGRNAAEFTVEEATTEQLVAAITGASDNVVSRSAPRAAHGCPGRSVRWLTSTADGEAEATAVAADLADERLIQSQGVSGYLRLQANRLAVR